MSDSVEWKDRLAFAEIAEALDTSTEYIFAARMEEGRWFILYTPDYPDDHTMWSAWLRRDSDHILRIDSVGRAHPGMWERIEEGIKEALE